MALLLTANALPSNAAPAREAMGRDFQFPARIEGMPSRLSDFTALQINSFITSDGVKLAYWEAGSGEPLVFVPGFLQGLRHGMGRCVVAVIQRRLSAAVDHLS